MVNNNATLSFIMSLTDKVSTPLQKISKGFDNLTTQAKATTQMIAGGLGTVVASMWGIHKSLQPAIQMNQALLDVKGFGVTETALKRLNNAALDFTASYGTSAEGFVGSAGNIQQALQNLTDTQLVKFTNASNLLAVHGKKDAAAMTNYITTVYSGFDQQINAMGRGKWVETFASQTAMATQLFKTNTDQLQAAFKDTAALAGRAGLNITDQLAVFGTLGNSMDGGKAGGAIKSVIENASGAANKLGLSFTDASGRMLPIVDIVDKLNNKFGDLSLDKNTNAIRSAFGGQGGEAMMLLMKDTEKLKGSIAQLGKVHGLEHVQKLAEQSVDPWQRLNGQVQALRISLGQALLPALTPLFDKLANIGQSLQRWAVLFPNLTKLVGLFVIGIVAANAAIGFITMTVGVFKNAWLALTLVGKGITAVMWLFNAALWANPITLIVVGIMAAVVVVGLAIYFWKDWTAFLVGAFSQGIEYVMGLFDGITAWFGSIGGWVGVLKTAWDAILQIFYKAIDTVISYLNYIPGVNIKVGFAESELPNFDQDLASVTTASQQAAKAGQAVIEAQQIRNKPPKNLDQVLREGAIYNQNQSKQIHIDHLTIENDKPMNPGELQNMLLMQAG